MAMDSETALWEALLARTITRAVSEREEGRRVLQARVWLRLDGRIMVVGG